MLLVARYCLPVTLYQPTQYVIDFNPIILVLSLCNSATDMAFARLLKYEISFLFYFETFLKTIKNETANCAVISRVVY